MEPSRERETARGYFSFEHGANVSPRIEPVVPKLLLGFCWRWRLLRVEEAVEAFPSLGATTAVIQAFREIRLNVLIFVSVDIRWEKRAPFELFFHGSFCFGF